MCVIARLLTAERFYLHFRFCMYKNMRCRKYFADSTKSTFLTSPSWSRPSQISRADHDLCKYFRSCPCFDLLKSLEALTAFILHCHVINNRFGFGASSTSDFYAIVRDATVIHSFLNTMVNSFK